MAIISKHELAECFEDTRKFIDEDSSLRAATVRRIGVLSFAA